MQWTPKKQRTIQISEREKVNIDFILTAGKIPFQPLSDRSIVTGVFITNMEATEPGQQLSALVDMQNIQSQLGADFIGKAWGEVKDKDVLKG